jgi:hypothetical protein
MAYLGQQPVVGRYILLDQISGGFNGTASGFTMSTAAGAQGVIPGLAQNVLLSLGGVIQQPGVDYTISGSGLTFTTPPVSGTTFFATVLGDAQSVGTPSDGTVTPASIASGFDFVFPNLSVTGVHTIASGTAAIPSLTITGDTDTGLFSPAANVLAITTSGSAALTVSGSNVGVGTSSPSANLELASGPPSFKLTRNTTASTGNDFGRILFENSAGTTLGSIRGYSESANTDLGLKFSTGTGDTVALTIDEAQRVGVGTTSPGSLLSTFLETSDTWSSAAALSASPNSSFTGLRIENNDTSANVESALLFIADTTQHSISSVKTGSSVGDLAFRRRTGASTSAESLRIDSDGRLLIGRNAVIGATSTLETYRTTNNTVFIASTDATTGNTATLNFGPANEVTGAQIICEAENDFSVAANRTSRLEFHTRLSGTLSEAMRIKSNGTLQVGGNSDLGSQLLQVEGATNATADFIIANNVASSGQTSTITFAPANNITGGRIICEAEEDFSSGANRTARLEFYTRLDGTLAERFRIRSNGDVTTTTDASFTRTTAGFTARAGDSVSIARAGAALEVSRLSNDGVLVQWFRDATGVGTVSVLSGTVSYNPFLGSHWARLEDDSKPEILVGTVLETIDKLMDWRIATFTVNGEQKISTYHGPANVGDTVQIEYEGQTYDAIVSLEEDPTDSLNKHVCVKVSDTAASAGVYGVFLGWDEDVQSEYINTWNDLYCAAVGNYFIRIAAGQTVAIGDLIESDGNGCGVVQSDDIIRSKTVGKVTSTIPQETYDDGSFLVTCVLCCG